MQACPSQDQLRDLLAQQLSGADTEVVTTHLEECDSCQKLLEEWTGTLLDCQPGGAAPASADSALRSGIFLQKLKKTPPPTYAQRDGFQTATAPADEQGREPGSWPAPVGYEILGELGRGGMGVVFKARHHKLNRLVALKMILACAQGKPELLARFRREAEAVASLQHPNIIQIHEVGDQDGQPFFSLELVEGGSLAQRLAGTPQPPSAAAQLLETLARAIHYAHQRGVIHRDLKPANILLKDEGGTMKDDKQQPGSSFILHPSSLIPKITDFGLAKQLDQDAGQTQASAILGTPSYMAPEQAAGNSKVIGPAADVYALGAILYEMLTGRPPFRGETALDTVQLVKTEEPVPPRRLQPKVPRDLETICLKCLQKEPRKRYASSLALAEDLERFRTGKPIDARPVHALGRLWRLVRRNPLPASLASMVFLLLLTIAVGASLSAWMLREERNVARMNEQSAQRAQREATDRLWDSYLAQARAGRYSGLLGRSFDGLDVLTKAAAIRPSLELRNEAIACLTLPDLRFVKHWETGAAHPNMINFDSRLEHYALSDAQGNISVRRVTDNHETMRLPGPGEPAWVVQFSRDGKFLAARHHLMHKHRKGLDIHLWNLTSAETIRKGSIRLPGRTWDFSPDNKQLAAGQDDDTILVFDLGNLGSARKPKRLPARGFFYRLAFGPDDQLAIAFAKEPDNEWEPARDQAKPVVQIRNIPTDTLLRTLPHPQEVLGLAWRDDGRFLATACADQRLYVWNAHTGKQQSMLEGHQAKVTAVTFSHGGTLLASTGWDDTLRLWDPLTGKQQVGGPCPGQFLPQFSQDDRLLGCLLNKSKIAIAEVASGSVCRILGTHQPDEPCWGVDFSPDGTLLASASNDGVRVWDSVAAKEVAFLPTAGRTVSAVFHPKKECLFTSGQSGCRRWDIQPGPGGKTILRRGFPLDPTLENLPAGRLNSDRDGKVWAVTFPEVQEEKAIVVKEDRSAKVVTLTHPRIDYGHLSPDGTWLVTGTWGGLTTKVWDAGTGKLADEWSDGDAYAAFSPDGRWLVIGSAAEYRFWSVPERPGLGPWQPGLRIPRNTPGGAGPLAFTYDSKMLAIVHSARLVRLVDTATGTELATLAAPHPQMIHWLAFSPDGGQLAVACANQTVQLWDLRLIRQELAQRHLDWDLPSLRPARAPKTVRMHVDLTSS